MIMTTVECRWFCGTGHAVVDSSCKPAAALLLLLQRLEREIADFSKDHDKRVKAATAKLKAAKQVRRTQPNILCR
jgi:hypothetical protein